MPQPYILGLGFACAIVVAIAAAANSYFSSQRKEEPYQRRPENMNYRETGQRNWNRSRRNSEENCSICFCPLNEKEQKRIPCGHVYHLLCIRLYIAAEGEGPYRCPLCRERFVR